MPDTICVRVQYNSLMINFYGLICSSDPGLRISFSPCLLHYCKKKVDSGSLSFHPDM